MIKANLSEEILKVLLLEDKPSNVKHISKQINVSEKSIWNLMNSDRFKKMLGKVNLIRKPGVGIYLEGTDENIQKLNKRFNSYNIDLEVSNTSCNDKNIRKNLILIDLFKAVGPISTSLLADEHYISKSSIDNDLNNIESQLNVNDIMLVRKQNVGIYLKGDEFILRQYFEGFIISLNCSTINVKENESNYSEIDDNLYSVLNFIFPLKSIKLGINIIQEMERVILGYYTEESFKENLVQLLITMYRFKNGYKLTSVKCEKDIKFTEFSNILQNYRCNLDINELQFLWIKFTCSRFKVIKNIEIGTEYINFSKELLSSVLNNGGNEAVDNLTQSLAAHLSQAVKRSKMGIKVHNPMLNKIKEQYSNFYAMILTNINKFETKYNIAFNEDEIGFIALYICAFVEENLSNQYYKILIVCDKGIGVSQLIGYRLRREFKNLIITNSISSRDLQEKNFITNDLILTTTGIDNYKKYQNKIIKVNDILNSENIETINAIIWELQEKNIYRNESYILKKSFDFDIKVFKDSEINRYLLLEKYSKIALKMGYANECYIESVLKRERRASTSIGKRIAIPHGNEQFINKPAIIIIQNKNLIEWGTEKVDTILLLLLKFNDMQQNKSFFYRLFSYIEKPLSVRNINTDKEILNFKNYLLGEDDIYGNK